MVRPKEPIANDSPQTFLSAASNTIFKHPLKLISQVNRRRVLFSGHSIAHLGSLALNVIVAPSNIGSINAGDMQE